MADANLKLAERLKQIQMQNQQATESHDLSDLNHNDELDITVDDIRDVVESIDDVESSLTKTPTEDIDETEELVYPEENDVQEETINEQPAPEPERKLSVKEKAERANMKYGAINVQPKEKIEVEDNSAGNILLNSLKEIDEDSKRMSEQLHREQDAYMAAKQREEGLIADENAKETELESDIDDIIASMGEDIEEKPDEEQDLETLLKEMEENKLYSKVEPTEEVTGPADYIIEKDETYMNNVEEILKSNNIIISKKNANERNAILDRFVNSGDKITMALVNSGIYVTMSGAGTSEIIAMNSMDGSESETRKELDKLSHICTHIVGSSIGKMKLSQLIKVVSYWDKDSLYYALFAATHPNVSELSRTCDRCGEEYFMNIHTKDLLLNPEDFEKSANDIRDNVTTYARLVETSELGKIYKKAHSNGMIIYYKHPSIESYLTTMRTLTPETMNKHYGLIDIVYGIDKIAIQDHDNTFIEIIDPNEIIDIISKLKNAEEKYEIFDMFESIKPNAVPTYGFKKSVCPHCGYKNDIRTFSMENILFTKAQQEEYEASLRWAVKTQKRKKLEKK